MTFYMVSTPDGCTGVPRQLFDKIRLGVILIVSSAHEHDLQVVQAGRFEKDESMNGLKWYYILGIFVGIIAVVAVIYWIVRTTDLLSRINYRQTEKLPDAE